MLRRPQWIETETGIICFWISGRCGVHARYSLEKISESQVRLRFRCGQKIKETQRLVPFVASMVDQCCTTADFKKWKGGIAQMSKSSLQRAGETAGLGMMPVKTQEEKLLQADVFKMRGAAMGQHASMDDFFRTDEAQQVLQKRQTGGVWYRSL